MARPPGVARALFASELPAQDSSAGSDELARLKRQLKDNERIWARFRRIEIRIIGAQTLRELVSVLADEFAVAFPQVDYVTLACHDPEYELTRLMEAADTTPRAASDQDTDRQTTSPGAFVAIERDQLTRLFQGRLQPRLIRCDRTLQQLLFPESPYPLGSAALAPLVLHGELIGTLNQGSRDPAHFVPDTATDLLAHLAAVVAMCVDNVVQHERMRWYGLTDSLTGIANRRFFERRLAEEVERWFRQQEPLALMLIDVDHFKQVNDQYGHQVGDHALREMAGLFGRDLRGADVLARYGGEEFVLLLPNTARPQALAIAERLCACVARHRFAVGAGKERVITVSIGVASLDHDSDLNGELPGEWLLNRADGALYQAKHAGRNRVVPAEGIVIDPKRKK